MNDFFRERTKQKGVFSEVLRNKFYISDYHMYFQLKRLYN